MPAPQPIRFNYDAPGALLNLAAAAGSAMNYDQRRQRDMQILSNIIQHRQAAALANQQAKLQATQLRRAEAQRTPTAGRAHVVRNPMTQAVEAAKPTGPRPSQVMQAPAGPGEGAIRIGGEEYQYTDEGIRHLAPGGVGPTLPPDQISRRGGFAVPGMPPEQPPDAESAAKKQILESYVQNGFLPEEQAQAFAPLIANPAYSVDDMQQEITRTLQQGPKPGSITPVDRLRVEAIDRGIVAARKRIANLQKKIETETGQVFDPKTDADQFEETSRGIPFIPGDWWEKTTVDPNVAQAVSQYEQAVQELAALAAQRNALLNQTTTGPVVSPPQPAEPQPARPVEEQTTEELMRLFVEDK